MKYSPDKQIRHGSVAPLTALLVTILLAMAAFAVDLGWITLAYSDLQNAADSAALAGAGQLMSSFVQYNSPGVSSSSKSTILSAAKTSAKTYAKNFASYNSAGGVKNLTLMDQDIEFGFTDAQGAYTAESSSQYSTKNPNGYPNTIKVTMRLQNKEPDGTTTNPNGALGLFFGPALGKSTADVVTTAAATIYTANINSFASKGINGLLLPVALDVNQWNQFMANGKSPDGTIHNGPNGNPQMYVYPNPGNAPGNFGLLDIGPPANDVPDFRTWIDYGPSGSDLQYQLNNNLLPVSAALPELWKGGPGMKSTLQSDFSSIMGTPRLLPLFKPVTTTPYVAAIGQGSNTYYNIVGFVGVTVTQADGHGSNMDISVQPSFAIDPTAILDMTSVAAAGTGSTSSMTTFTTPKLTQ